jgi:hypothetical protein
MNDENMRGQSNGINALTASIQEMQQLSKEGKGISHR